MTGGNVVDVVVVEVVELVVEEVVDEEVVDVEVVDDEVVVVVDVVGPGGMKGSVWHVQSSQQ